MSLLPSSLTPHVNLQTRHAPTLLQSKHSPHQKLPGKHAFPQIHSPFLKKTIYHLFPSIETAPNAPSKRYGNPLQIQKEEKLTSQDLQTFASRGLKAAYREQCESETEVVDKMYRRIGKSFSESKRQPMHFEDMTEKLLTIKKSEKRMAKVVTESSSTSKEIYKKLSHLNEKNRVVSLQQQQGEWEGLKAYKQSNFVMKYKLAKSVHCEQSQLRNLKEGNSQGLRDNIKIKNYTKFSSHTLELLH